MNDRNSLPINLKKGEIFAVQKIMEFQLCKFSKEDIVGLVNLSALVGWDYDDDEIHTILSVGTIYGHKTAQGEIISSAAIIPYDHTLASIGMVIVKEQYRGYRLGKELTQACINSVHHNVSIMLIATEAGYPLYEKLGFKTVTTVHKLLSNQDLLLQNQQNDDYEVCPLSDHHFPHIHNLDQNAVGADRKQFLKARIKQAKQGVVIKGENGKVVGFGLSIEGPVNLILGPIVALNDDIAIYIIHHLAKEYKGKLRIDVPDGKNSFVTYLEQCGFIKVSQPPVMIKNSSTLPLRNHSLYGIAAQIFG